MKTLRHIVVIAAALIAASALAACGSSTKSSRTGAASTPAAGSDTTSGAQTPAKPTGTPIKVMFHSDTVPGADLFGTIGGGAKGAEKYINEELGGFGGHPVDVIYCDGKLNPGATTACANKAVAEGAIGMFGLGLSWGTNGLPVLTKAGLPSFNGGAQKEDYVSKTEIALQATGPGGYAAIAQFMCDRKAKTMVIMETDVPTAGSNWVYGAKILKNCGINMQDVRIPPTAADYSSFVRQAISKNPDFIMLNFGEGPVQQIMKGLKTANFPADKVVGDVSATNTKFLKGLGSAAEGMYFTMAFTADPNNADFKTYLEKMKKYEPDTYPEDQLAEWGFSNLMAIRAAAEKVGFDKVDGPSLLSLFKGGQAQGLPVFLGHPIDTPPAQLQTLYQPWSQIGQWKGGQMVVAPSANGGWINGLGSLK